MYQFEVAAITAAISSKIAEIAPGAGFIGVGHKKTYFNLTIKQLYLGSFSGQ